MGEPDLSPKGLRHSVQRLLILLPLVSLFVAAATLAGLSPLFWGKGQGVGFHPWMPSAIGVVLAAPALISSLVALRALLARTKTTYRIQLVNLPFALLVILFFVGAEIHFARQLFLNETYETF